MMKKSSILIYGAIIATSIAALLCYGISETQRGERLCINELMGKSAAYLYEGNGAQERWIEIFNGTAEDINLDGYGLTNDMDFPYLYRFPDVTLESGGYLVVYTTGEKGKDGGLYADFGLNPRGEAVALTDPDGKTADKVSFDKCVTDSPYGRKPDGGEFALLNRATKGRTNESLVSRYMPSEDYSSEAVFSHEEGYYGESFPLSLSCGEGEVIYYTLDGSVPDISSEVYRKPIQIEDRSDDPNRYAPIRSTEKGTLVGTYGSEKVKKGTIIRTRTAKNGRLSANTSTRTYFVGEKPSLLTVSLVTEPKNLFDFFDGIYVPGYIYGRYVRSSTVKNPVLGNYTLRGRGAERPVAISFFEDGKPVFRDNSGLGITSGRGNTATSPVKSLQLMASYKKEEVGKRFPASLLGESGAEGYKTMILRTRSQFVPNELIDVYVNQLARGDDFKVQKARPVIVYINGEYWGLAHLRDKIDEDFVFANFGIHQDNLAMLKYQIVEGASEIVLKKGRQEDYEDYMSLIEYAGTHDLSQDQDYQYVADRLDIENYIKNYIVRIFCACHDWPDNNVRVFRAVNPDGSTYGDGKWRTILYDSDFACLDSDAEMIRYALGEKKRVDNNGFVRPVDGAEDLFKALMENPGFREALKDQYEIYKKTIFSKENMNRVLDELLAELGDEFENHAVRWSRHSSWLGRIAEGLGSGSPEIDQWEEEREYVERIRIFIDRRSDFLDNEFEEIYARYDHE